MANEYMRPGSKIQITSFIIALLFVLGWTILLFFKKPSEIVEFLGVYNSYTSAFLISLFGAFSSFTTFSTYPAIITLAAAGVNPLILGIVAGLGLAAGDILFFFFGKSARGISHRGFKRRMEKIFSWLLKKPLYFIRIFTFLYVGFTPLPNNLLTGSLALAGLKFRQLALPLILGDMVLPLLAAYLSATGVNLFINS